MSAKFILFRTLAELSFTESEIDSRYFQIESFLIDGSNLLPEGSLGLKDSVETVYSIERMCLTEYGEIYGAINRTATTMLLEIATLFDDLETMFQALEELKDYWEIEDPPVDSSSISSAISSSELIPSSSDDDSKPKE
jgi:hypothetical protein